MNRYAIIVKNARVGDFLGVGGGGRCSRVESYVAKGRRNLAGENRNWLMCVCGGDFRICPRIFSRRLIFF